MMLKEYKARDSRKEQKVKIEEEQEIDEDKAFLSKLNNMTEKVKIYRDSFYYKEPNFHNINETHLTKMVHNRC